ncbi:phytoene/squalene synthase family protein [Actinopolyspora mortivallis]|uniref:Phytoene synthase n=1 Tax=Actinopolyspora mortivallis TaxID=33906 RepID=A0A2T0GUF3_ACTMO|nr:phytoene/squalene synthase family protein [Actinopolyspora mortivallis]PRW62739.1 phytoene synthase [Actinopolyspora mortivallis]
MSAHELDAAGIHDPALRTAYRHCRSLNSAHGRTYFLATRMLPAARRPAVHALYGLARQVDDIVDDPTNTLAPETRRRLLDELADELDAALSGGHGDSPVVTAVVDTARRYGIRKEYFDSFMRSMRQDLTVSDYPDRASLNAYVHGSAEVIGLQVLPVLGTEVPAEQAAPYAAALGNAFQLTNFLRDVGEDLRRGRVYLPADELAVFGVDRRRLQQCLLDGRPDRQVRRALADQVARTRAVYHYAAPGIDLLDPIARPCVSTAYTLYGEILDRIVESDYDVFAHRISVPGPRRLGVALAGAAGVANARIRSRSPGTGKHVSSYSTLGGR